MFTFTSDELSLLLSKTITEYAGGNLMYFSEEYRQIRDATVERIMAQLEASQPQRDTLLENSLPAIDEDEINYDLDRRSVKEYSSHDFCPSCGSADLYLNTCFACGQKNISDFDEDEDPDWWIEDSQATEHLRLIPFDGQPIPYESDNDSPAELGLLPAA